MSIMALQPAGNIILPKITAMTTLNFISSSVTKKEEKDEINALRVSKIALEAITGIGNLLILSVCSPSYFFLKCATVVALIGFSGCYGSSKTKDISNIALQAINIMLTLNCIMLNYESAVDWKHGFGLLNVIFLSVQITEITKLETSSVRPHFV